MAGLFPSWKKRVRRFSTTVDSLSVCEGQKRKKERKKKKEKGTRGKREKKKKERKN